MMFLVLTVLQACNCSLVEKVGKIMTKDIKNTTTKFVGVIDAGTTGTRLNVFGFIMPGTILTSFDIYKSKPGLHTLTTEDDMKNAVNSLLKRAEKKLKKKDIDLRTIPLTFTGTAGIRSLPEEKQNTVLKAVNALLNDYNKLNNKSYAISAFTEGLFALDAIEFLKDYNNLILYQYGCENDEIHKMLDEINESFCDLKAKDSEVKYSGILEMGGGSIQIAYEFEKKNKYNDPLHVIETTSKKIYINAYPGWGLEEGLKTLDTNKDYVIKNGHNQITMRDELIKDFKDSKRPDINKTDELYLLAFFYDKYTELGFKFETTMKEIQDKTKKKCNGKNTQFCKEINYLNMFLEAQGLKKDKKLYLIRDIAGVNTSWTVTQALEML